MRFILVVFLFVIGVSAEQVGTPESFTILERCKDLEIRVGQLKAMHGIIGGRVLLVEEGEFRSVMEDFQRLEKRFFMLQRPDHFVDRVRKEEEKRQQELEKVLKGISKLLREKYQAEVIGDWNRWNKEKEKNKRRGKSRGVFGFFH